MIMPPRCVHHLSFPYHDNNRTLSPLHISMTSTVHLVPSSFIQSVVSALGPGHILAADNASGRALIALAQSSEALQLAWGRASGLRSAAVPSIGAASVTEPTSCPQGGGSGVGTSAAAAGSQPLEVTWVPDQICANVLRIGKHVVMQRGAVWCVCPGDVRQREGG